jgi:hypothetical protein
MLSSQKEPAGVDTCKPFLTVQKAQIWVDGFVDWYNKEHLHSSSFIAPDDRHVGRKHAILAKRCRLYMNKNNKPRVGGPEISGIGLSLERFNLTLK